MTEIEKLERTNIELVTLPTVTIHLSALREEIEQLQAIRDELLDMLTEFAETAGRNVDAHYAADVEYRAWSLIRKAKAK